jgi:transposase-like protein
MVLFAMKIHLHKLVDERKCYQQLRAIRWEYGVKCSKCDSTKIRKRGKSSVQKECQRYECKVCHKRFDDLSGTVFSNRHQSLSVWVVFLYLLGLNLSTLQIAQELGLNSSDSYYIAEKLRKDVGKKKPKVELRSEVEFDEVYVIAGHKGKPSAIKGRKPRRNRLKGARGRGTLEKEKPPIFGMIQRNGDVHIEMLPNVKQETIQPIIEATVEKGTLVYTDEYSIYSRLENWGYQHKTVNHSQHEYARDEDGDGFYEVHVNTMEGFWSLLRSWLRPHRGISQEKLPLYLGFFEFVHNAKKRGRALLGSLLTIVLQ